MHADSALHVTVAGNGRQHALGVGRAVDQWKARWPAGGDVARRRYVAWLQKTFDSLACEFPGCVAFGSLVRVQASRTRTGWYGVPM